MATKPIIQFDPSQRRVFDDQSRVIVVNFHRQKGKDFVSSGKAVDNCLRTGNDWYIVSLTQRQADATFAKARKFAETYKEVLKLDGEITYSEREYAEYDAHLKQNFQCLARELRLPGGGKVVSLPGRDPDTLAGLTGNVIFTEFGLFPNGGYDHWRVVFPLCTRGFQVMVISTPRGKNTKFYELHEDPETYSVHTCSIYKSVAEDGYVLKDNQGNPCSIEQFKRLYNDDAGWPREYGCEFSGDAFALINWSWLEAAGVAGATEPFDILRINNGDGYLPGFFLHQLASDLAIRFELGWDVARHSHFSSLWVNSKLADGRRLLRALVLMHETPFTLQRAVIRAAMDSHPHNVGCGDSTGLGMDSNETLEELYGNRWQGVNFGGSRKSELGSALYTAFDDRMQLLPAIDGPHKFIHADLYAIQTPNREEAKRNERRLQLIESENPLEPNSHCDIAYSAALALRAQSIESIVAGATVLSY